MSRNALQSLVRRRVPGLQLSAPINDEPIRLMTYADAASDNLTRICSMASRPIRAGEIITQSALAPSTCSSEGAPPPLSFDRMNRVIRATSDIAQGTALGALQAPQQAFDAGDELSLFISVGSVRIERQVEAIQPGQAGQNIFVREANGDVLSAPTLQATAEKPHDE